MYLHVYSISHIPQDHSGQNKVLTKTRNFLYFFLIWDEGKVTCINYRDNQYKKLMLSEFQE